MLTDKVKPLRLDVPGEEGAWFEVRQVSGDELDEAQARFQQRAMAMEISQGMARAMSDVQRGVADDIPLTVDRCDKATLLRYGLVGWGGGAYEGEPCNDGRKAKLDAGTRDWAASEIFRMSYVTKGEASRSEPSMTSAGSPNGSSERSTPPSLMPVSSMPQESSPA